MNINYSKFIIYLFIAACLGRIGEAKPKEWNQFRGPNGDGDAGMANLPIKFSETKNLTWKTSMPGKAWSSPVVSNGNVWITNAEENGFKMWAIQLDWITGKQLKKILVFENKKPQFCHPMNSYATSTPVIAGNQVFVHFGSHGTAALNVNSGQKIWERRDFKCDHYRGAAASPIPYLDTLIVHFDGHDYQYIVCLNQKTGKTIWKKERAYDFKTDNGDRKKAYCTPSVIKHNGRVELISPGAVATESRNPKNGELYWTARTGGMNSSSRPILRHGLVYIFCGMGSMSAIRPGGNGDVDETHLVWNRRKVVPKKSSPLLLGDYLFMISDEGVASCNNPKTGEVYWAERLGVKGQCASSPIHANGLIYSFSSEGDCVVFKPAPNGLQIISRNKLAHGCMASPAVVGNSLLVRTKQNLYRFDRHITQ
jgi:outer membrane protein assembly factor BamB